MSYFMNKLDDKKLVFPGKHVYSQKYIIRCKDFKIKSMLYYNDFDVANRLGMEVFEYITRNGRIIYNNNIAKENSGFSNLQSAHDIKLIKLIKESFEKSNGLSSIKFGKLEPVIKSERGRSINIKGKDNNHCFNVFIPEGGCTARKFGNEYIISDENDKILSRVVSTNDNESIMLFTYNEDGSIKLEGIVDDKITTICDLWVNKHFASCKNIDNFYYLENSICDYHSNGYLTCSKDASTHTFIDNYNSVFIRKIHFDFFENSLNGSNKNMYAIEYIQTLNSDEIEYCREVYTDDSSDYDIEVSSFIDNIKSVYYTFVKSFDYEKLLKELISKEREKKYGF